MRFSVTMGQNYSLSAVSQRAPCGSKAQGYYPAAPQSEAPAMNTQAPETIKVDDTRVSCEGIGGALGHPKVYLEMGDENFVECPYCDRRFVPKAAGHRHWA